MRDAALSISRRSSGVNSTVSAEILLEARQLLAC
jgi:hypothetical protein